MEKENLKISIPDEIANSLDLEENDLLNIEVNHGKIVVQSEAERTTIAPVTMKSFMIPAAIVSIIFAIMFYSMKVTLVPLDGDVSMASYLIVAGSLSGIACFVYFFIKRRRKYKDVYAKKIYWRNFLTVVLSLFLILVYCLVGIFWIIGIMLTDVSFDIFTTTILVFSLTCIINYFMINLANYFSPALIINTLILVIVGGVFISMLDNSAVQWWHHNFSYLGTENALSSWQFNLTLVVSAFLIAALTDYLFVFIFDRYPNNKRLMVLKVLLWLTAIALGGIAIFPNNGEGMLHEIHDHFARSSIFCMLVIIVFIRWLMPMASKAFLELSSVTALILVFVTFLWKGLNYLSLTAFEFISFVIVFGWILLLFAQLQSIMYGFKQSYTVRIEKE